jgi:hypothetical protein
MKKVLSLVIVASVLVIFVLSSCSSGAGQQTWHPKKGKKPKPGHNHGK